MLSTWGLIEDRILVMSRGIFLKAIPTYACRQRLAHGFAKSPTLYSKRC